MKKNLIYLLIILIIGCNQDKQPILGETEFQIQMNSDFKDATKSPLKEKDRK